MAKIWLVAMVDTKITDRIEFLAKKFDVFEVSEENIEKKVQATENTNISLSKLLDNSGNILALVHLKADGESVVKYPKSVSVSFDIFTKMIEADPTPNKSCVQWMLNTFVRFIKEGKSNLAIQFAIEDLPLANEYINIFEANKRKNKFKEFCKNSYILKGVIDPMDINQYKSLSQLFDAVDPFIVKNPSEMEKLLNKFVDMGQADIPVKDRKFTLYIPKTRDASVIFHKFANWCTARPENGMFASYTNNRRPDGTNSKLYIIINNKFFTGESNEIYQIHFESNQIKDRHNSTDVSIFESVMEQSEAILNFFYDELIGMAKVCATGINNNKYLDYLIKFGFTESLFELLDEDTPIIRFMTREIPKMPSLSKFKMVDQLIITDAKLTDIHPSIGDLTNLEIVALTNNKIKSIPKEIGKLKKLSFINLSGNKIEEIPDEIAYLDRKNGGSLFRISVRENEIGKENYQKLKRLLPTAAFYG